MPQKDLVGKFHFLEILPKPKHLQKGLIYRSCKYEYQNVVPVRYGPVMVSLELSINIAPLLSIFFLSFCSTLSPTFPLCLRFSPPIRAYLGQADWHQDFFVHLQRASDAGASANRHNQNSGDTTRVRGLLWDCNLLRL